MADTVINTAIYKIEIDTSGAKAALNDFDKTLESNGKKVEQKSSLASRAFNKAWQMAAGGAKSSIVKAFSAVTDQIIGFPKQILNVGAGFEQSMANVSAIMGATGDDLDKLSEKARDWGQNSKFSATEVADGFGYMAMAGWDTQQALDGIDAVLQLAVAGGTDLATTSDIVTDALTAFGYKASDAGKFADVLAAASSSANTNVSLMGESFKYAAPVAGALGYSVEDTAKAIGLMANAGIKGSEAGTALRTILTNMASPTDDMAYAMERLGVSISDENGNMKSLGTIMEDLRSGFGELMIPEEEFQEKLAKLNEDLANGTLTQKKYDDALDELTRTAYGAEGAEKARVAAMLAGKEGMSGLLAIVGAAPEDYDKLSEAIDNSAGASKEMMEVMGNTTANKIAELQNKIGELALKGFEKLKPAIDKVIEVIGWVIDNIDKLIPVIIALGVVMATIKIVDFAKKLSSTFGGAIKTTKKFASKLTGMFKKDIGDNVSKVAGESTTKIGESMAEKISGLGETISTAFKILGDILASAVGAVLEPVKAVFRGVGEAIAGFFKALANPEIAVGAAMFAVVAASIAAAILLIGAAIGLTMPVWKELFDNIIMPTAVFIRDTVLILIETLTDNLIKLTNEALIPLGKFLVDSFLGIIDGVTGAITNFTQNAIVPLINTMSGALMGILKTVSDFLNNTLKTAFEGVKGIIDSIGTAFEKMGTVITNALNSVNGILGTFKDLLLGIADAVVAVVALATGQSVNYGNGFARVTKAAMGGRVYGIGTETSDSNLFALSKGEYVIRAAAARQIGYENLDALNSSGRMTEKSDEPNGGNPTYNIYVEGVFATSDEEKRHVADQIVEAIKQNNKRRFA